MNQQLLEAQKYEALLEEEKLKSNALKELAEEQQKKRRKENIC